jgi:hypothetical protein
MAKKVGTPAPDTGAPKGKKLTTKQLNINKGKKLPPSFKQKK